MTIKKNFKALFAATVLCCGVITGTASAQFFEMEDDPWSTNNDSPASSYDSQPSDDGWNTSMNTQTEAPAGVPEPASTTKATKAEKPQKPVKQAAAGNDMLNLFGSVGWAFGIGEYYLGENVKYRNNGTERASVEDQYINLGNGLKLEIGVGYMMTPDVETRFSVDLGFGIFTPETFTKPDVDTEIYTDNQGYYNINFKAMVVPQFDLFDLLDAYVGAGLVLGIANSTYDSTRTIIGQTDKEYRIANYERQFSVNLGFCGLLGVLFPLSEDMSFFSEIQFQSLSFKQTANKLTGKTPDIPTHAPSSPTFEKDDRYADPPPNYPASSWGIRFGIKYWVL